MRIEAYYNGLKSANYAVETLKNQGFNNSAVDLNDNYIDFDNYKYNFSDAIINSGGFSNNSYKSNTISSGGFQDIPNSSYKVVINSNLTNDMAKLKQLILETGGKLKTKI
ncbi:hypothetical protein J2Z42_000521 [Clostridium algifaecis]|uniref:LytR/CpsA/Psr regulator C-terminal domain-containing protein n=1 Tax=Clostridium algifaecis TaxID=1472040 RepID=A0ABS4KQU9_9CLOT|nr:hypothetical protein [Clostridium algifaecis]MBP2031856.1 hypothetical protein [Clostridium algifaecis]